MHLGTNSKQAAGCPQNPFGASFFARPLSKKRKQQHHPEKTVAPPPPLKYLYMHWMASACKRDHIRLKSCSCKRTYLLSACFVCQKHSSIEAYSPSFDTWVAKENSAKGKHSMAQILATSTMCCCVSASSAYIPYIVCTSNARTSGSGSFRGERAYKPKKNVLIECAQGHQLLRCPNGFFLCAQTFRRCAWWWLVCWRGGDVMRCDVLWCCMMSCGWLRGEMKKCGWLWGDVRWGNVVGCEMSCHVMWCHVTWCDVVSCPLMRCDVMSDAMRCDVMWCAVINVLWCKCCNVMWSDVMSCDLMWSDAMGWDVMWQWCCEVGCEDLSCDAMWLCDVLDWQMTCCELRRAHDRKTLERSIPMRGETLGCKKQKTTESSCHSTTTPYYKGLLRTRINYDINVWKSQNMRLPAHCAEQCMGCKTRWNYNNHVW